MTREEYARIAEAIRVARNETRDGNGRFALHIAARRLADALAADNPRFDRDRFLAACGTKTV